jgi:alpha-tubulin suppressor-like RCC1 family protein
LVALLVLLLTECGGRIGLEDRNSEPGDGRSASAASGGEAGNAGDGRNGAADDGANGGARDGVTSAGGEAGLGGAAPHAGGATTAGAGSIGDPCSRLGSLACAGNAGKARLSCDGREWVDDGTCDDDHNCDTRSGTCEPILAGCRDKSPGAPFCASNGVRVCGVDLTTSSPAGDCQGGVCRVRDEVPLCVRSVDIAAGLDHTCATSNLGSVRCWGEGASGQLGYGNRLDVGDGETPASLADVTVGAPVARVAAGATHTCALLQSGAVRCWGDGANGKLGYGGVVGIGGDGPFVLTDIDLGGPALQIAAGAFHTCALMTTGAVRCWGQGANGKLGYGNTRDVGDDEHPRAAGDVAIGGTVTSIAAGSDHTCAVLEGGAVRCWGLGTSGRLGYGNVETIGDDELPESVAAVDLGGPAAQVAAGALHTCARLQSGEARCWGASTGGRLGFFFVGPVGDDEVPSSVAPVDIGAAMVVDLATTGEHTCALLTFPSGALRCWGVGGSGRLGYGNTDNVGDGEAPGSVGPVIVGGPVAAVAAGAFHTCALLTNGAVRCWGAGEAGRLGYGKTSNIGDGDGPMPAEAGNVPIF